MKSMKQLSLAETGFLPNAERQTRKTVFLAEMETILPWSRLEVLIEPFYPKRGNGRPLMPLSTMLRIRFMQSWFGYSDPAMEEALHDTPLLRKFAGLNTFEGVVPDESTILCFPHLLVQHELAVAMFVGMSGVLVEKGLTMKPGSVVNATLIAAANLTKNQEKKHDPQMIQSKKVNQRYFGMTSCRRRTPAGRSRETGRGHERSEATEIARKGVYAESGPIHTVEYTTAKVADIIMMKDCLHSEETLVLGDRGYRQKKRMIENFEAEDDVSILTPTKKPAGGELTEEQKAFKRMLSAVRAIVEHPFHVLKQQFGFLRLRYRGLKKNSGQIVTFCCADQFVAGTQIIAVLDGRGAPVKREIWDRTP